VCVQNNSFTINLLDSTVCIFHCICFSINLLGKVICIPIALPASTSANTPASREKPKIPPVDRILMDPSHKARKNPSDNADLGFQAVGLALHIMQLNVEGLSAAKRHIIQSVAEIHHFFSHTRRRTNLYWGSYSDIARPLPLLRLTDKAYLT